MPLLYSKGLACDV